MSDARNQARNSRVARHLIRRLARDCDVYYPGGTTNAGLVGPTKAEGWEVVPLDGCRAPRITGAASLTQLLRDGFIAAISNDGDYIRLYSLDVDENLLVSDVTDQSTKTNQGQNDEP